MTLSWRMRRQLLYYGVTMLVGVVVFGFVYISVFSKPPTCFDGKHNGEELGVDCGGTCSLVCEESAHAPKLLWSRSFRTSPSTYTAVAYIENSNSTAGAKKVPYSFKLFDSSGLLVKEKLGVIDLPPVLTIPIIEVNIDVGTRNVARTDFSFFSPIEWYTVDTKDIVALRVAQKNITSDGTRLDTTITSSALHDIRDIVVTAVLFDSRGVAQAASKSFVDTIAPKSSQNVVFTWPSLLPDIVQADVKVLPSF